MLNFPLIPAVAAAAAVAAPAPAGTIAFHQHHEGEASQIYFARADGSSGAVQLTTPEMAPDPAACFSGCTAEMPDWSADGSRIFFDSSWAPPVHVWSMRPDATGLKQHTSGDTFDGLPGVSNDMKAFAYDGGPPEGGDPATQGIYLKRLRSSKPAKQLTRGPADGFDSNPDISPNGRRIVFTRAHFRKHTTRISVWTVRTNGTHLRRVVDGKKVWGDPHWSPDGSKVLLQSYDEPVPNGGTPDEYTVRPDGTHLKALTHTGPNEAKFSGDWSPDGRHIVYVRGRDDLDHLEIRIMSASGKDRSLVAACDPALFCDNPSWGRYNGPLPSRDG